MRMNGYYYEASEMKIRFVMKVYYTVSILLDPMASSPNRIKHTVCFKPQIFLTHIADYLKKASIAFWHPTLYNYINQVRELEERIAKT